MDELKPLEDQLGYRFKEKQRLIEALTHKSYKKPYNNERLEFLGDAVLEFLTSEFLYHKYPNEEEGMLTAYRSALVRTETLAKTARRLGFGSRLKLSKGEDESGGRESEPILADTFEAFLGALFLDQGLDSCREFLKKELFPEIEEIIKNRTYKDYKSLLQEIAQEKVNFTPVYKVLKEWGPDHAKMFRVGVFIGEQQKGVGEGSSKQKAELAAARDALEKLNWL